MKNIVLIILLTIFSCSLYQDDDEPDIFFQFSDFEILELGKLKEADFNKKIQSLYLEKKNSRIKILGEDQNNSLEKKIFLQIIDFSWRSHLQYLEQLRQVIGLRSYGQRDPLIEYKKEAFELFENLLELNLNL